MGQITKEMIAKAKLAKTVKELIALAKEAEIDLGEEEARLYFEQLNPKSGELSDDELDDVSGGGCKSLKSKRVIVTSGCKCFTGCFESLYVRPEIAYIVKRNDNAGLRGLWASMCNYDTGRCGSCLHLEFEAGTGVCGKS